MAVYEEIHANAITRRLRPRVVNSDEFWLVKAKRIRPKARPNDHAGYLTHNKTEFAHKHVVLDDSELTFGIAQPRVET